MRPIYTLLLLLCTIKLCAQHQYVVVDMETNVPLRDVKVDSNGKSIAVSEWDGTFTLDSISEMLALHREGYERLKLMPEELTDTISLLPSLNRIDEVVIIGKRDLNRTMNFGIGSSSDMSFAPPPSGISFDFFKLFDFKGRKRERNRQRLKSKLDAY